jgi:MFS family permease
MIITLSIIAFIIFSIIYGKWADTCLFDYYPKNKKILEDASEFCSDPHRGRKSLVILMFMIYGFCILATCLILI